MTDATKQATHRQLRIPPQSSWQRVCPQVCANQAHLGLAAAAFIARTRCMRSILINVPTRPCTASHMPTLCLHAALPSRTGEPYCKAGLLAVLQSWTASRAAKYTAGRVEKPCCKAVPQKALPQPVLQSLLQSHTAVQVAILIAKPHCKPGCYTRTAECAATVPPGCAWPPTLL